MLFRIIQIPLVDIRIGPQLWFCRVGHEMKRKKQYYVRCLQRPRTSLDARDESLETRTLFAHSI